MGLSAWSSTPASNNASPPNGWPEGMAPSAINDTGRQMMADLRAWYEDAQWIDLGHTCTYASGTQFTIGGGVDRTGTYEVGRRVRAIGSLTTTIYGTISAAAYSAPTNTITVVWDSGSLQNETLSISLHIIGADERTFPSGTKLIFPGISSAPAGWTIDTTTAYDKAAIRIRTSGSTSTGGSVDFETAFASGSTGSYTLLAADMPSHTHTGTVSITDPGHFHSISPQAAQLSGSFNRVSGSGLDSGASATQSATTGITATVSLNNIGGGGGHSHSLSLAVKYLDACICVKS